MGSWNSIPTLATLHVPTAAELAFITTMLAADPEWLPVANKGSDQNVSSGTTGTTLVNDSALFATLAATAAYTIDMDLIWTSPTAADFKFDFTVPVGASGWWTALNPTLGSAASAPYLGALTWAGGGTFEGFAADMYARIRGRIFTTSTGTLQFRWAQNTANATNTTVRGGSVLSLFRTA